jgi:hypothetical protein
MMLSPDFNPYGGEWFDTVAELTANVEHLTDNPAEGAQGSVGRQGHQGAAGSINNTSGLPVPELTDSLALNNTIYYSITKGALVFKDSTGRILKLGIIGA